MGCSSTKFTQNKLKDTSEMFGDCKIQAVLHIDPKKPTKKTSKSKQRRKQAKDSKPRPAADDNRQKPTRPKSHKTAKFNYDPKITGKYLIKAVIGKGSCSRVFRVEHKVSKQPYALKVIETALGREAFEAEVVVLRRVNHPNVIKLFEVFDASQKVYMVMELATGGSLLDRLEAAGHLTEEDARDVIRMVVAGVKYLQDLGITHRDLKPDNLLYYHPGKDSRIMITDFSFASTRRTNMNSYMHTVCGTPQYIAPEIVARKPYTCSVDLWAVGVIAYIVLCGTFPFDDEHDAEIFKLILKAQYSMTDMVWHDVSTESKTFIQQLLQTDPARRLNVNDALNHDWLTSTKLTYSPHKSSHRGDGRSLKSSNSVGSSKSSRSTHSLRVSGHRRVRLHHLEALSSDPEIAAMI